MRTVVRAQLTQEALSEAITEGIRDAQREAGRASHERRLQEFKEADKATGGKICENIDALIKDDALLVQTLFASKTPADVKAARTEIERLIDYIGFWHTCGGTSVPKPD